MWSQKQNEPMSALTHFVGACLAIAGLVLLIVSATQNGTGMHIVVYTIFGVTMVLLYTVSTLYHLMCATNVRTKRVWQILDHVAIYLLIAGTYTPVALIVLPPAWGWTIFGLIWGGALLGIILKATQVRVAGWVSTMLYVGMGWLLLIAFVPLIESLRGAGLLWLILGGVFYTVGVVFFALEKFVPRTKWFGMHEVFHVFVMCGSFAHFWVMFRYVVYMQ